jgi:anti-sigma B factor antagonist
LATQFFVPVADSLAAFVRFRGRFRMKVQGCKRAGLGTGRRNLGDTSVKITREQIGDVTILAVHADYLDASNTPEFKRDITALSESSSKLVLDLSRVQFVDSAGCGGLLSFLRKLNAVGGDLKLCAVSKPVRTIFELIRFHRILDILNTKEEAVKAFQV